MEDEPKKNPLLSKTLWMNFLAGGLALFYPPAADWIAANPAMIVGIFAGINILLRLITKEGVQLLP